MRNYIIINQAGKQYDMKFKSDSRVKDWIINHLDLSENWLFYHESILSRFGHTIKELIYTGNFYKPYIKNTSN